MERTKYALLPRLTKILEGLGEDIKLARLRRKLSAGQVAERAGISRSTLWQIEKGLPNVSMGYYAQVLFVLGLEKNLSVMAADDVLGRKLQDAEILVKKRAPKKRIRDEQQ
jgi:transcriptional regulator with XRE-family HTH domain